MAASLVGVLVVAGVAALFAFERLRVRRAVLSNKWRIEVGGALRC